MCKEKESSMFDWMRHKKCECCCEQGPQGVPGLQGPQGIQGVPGAQGIPGANGAQGPQGIQGVPGKDGVCTPDQCKCDCPSAYCNVYSSTVQTIAPFGSVNDGIMFDSNNEVSLDFDISMKNITGQITFLKHGIYSLAWTVQGRIAPPVPDPVPSWSFGLWLDSVLVNGSVASGFTQSPNDDTVHVTAEVIVEVLAGQKLMLRNSCVSTVLLDPNASGSVFPIANSTLNIELLKEIV